MRRVRSIITWSVILVFLVVMNTPLFVKAEGDANEAAQDAKDAIFQIQLVYKDSTTGEDYVIKTATGFLIGADPSIGECIITCDHTIKLNEEELAGCKEFFELEPDSQFNTSLRVVIKGSIYIGANIVTESGPEDMDFAILKLDQPISERKTLPLRIEEAEETTDCYALGFPNNTSYTEVAQVYTSNDVTVTKGTITNKTTWSDYTYTQHSATISSGTVGGPVLDENGNVIGLSISDTWKEDDTYYYCLNISEVAEILDYFGIGYTKARVGDIASSTDPAELRSALTELIQKAESINTENCSPESVSNLNTAINNAYLINEYSTDQEVQEAYDQLNNAINELEEPIVVDKTALEEELNKAKELSEDDYDADAFEEFGLAIESAEEIFNKADATQEEVDAALEDLKNAKEELNNHKDSGILLIIIIVTAVVVVILSIILIIMITKKKKSKDKKPQPVNMSFGAPVLPNAQPRPQASYPQPSGTQPGGVPMAGVRVAGVQAPGAQSQTKPPEPPRRSQQQGAYPAPPTIPHVAEGAGQTVLLNEGTGETTMLSETNHVIAILVKTKTGEKVTITKKEFKIGKERNRVDYCISNNSVSRHHATIDYINGEYYLRDNNSTNLTYVNGEVISATQRVKLKNGDRIRFSDEEYQFTIY